MIFSVFSVAVHAAGRFVPSEARAKVACMEWLFFQVGGFGPIPGQVHHFLGQDDAHQEANSYSINRYLSETKRLYGVMDDRLSAVKYFAGDEYTIADMAIFGWAWRHERHQIDLAAFPHVERWYADVSARPAVIKALATNVAKL